MIGWGSKGSEISLRRQYHFLCHSVCRDGRALETGNPTLLRLLPQDFARYQPQCCSGCTQERNRSLYAEDGQAGRTPRADVSATSSWLFASPSNTIAGFPGLLATGTAAGGRGASSAIFH